MDTPRHNSAVKTIYLGGGCFWCTEAVFQSLRGILEVVPGYMGGDIPEPSYESVASGTTGHAEVVKVVYDETTLSTADLFDVFFEMHDPTTPNRQGADVGSQYRSIIFYSSEAMREAAIEAIARAQATLPPGKVIVTQVVEAADFYPAEEYHYNYYRHHADAPYCQAIISPKLEKLQKAFPEKTASMLK